MRRGNNIFFSLVFSAAGCGILTSCHSQSQQSRTPEVGYLQKDTTIYLQENSQTPSCKINLNLAYLQPASESDSLSPLINSTIQQTVFGAQYKTLYPQDLISSLTSEYIRNYNTEVKKLFEADLNNGMKPSDVPAWYNYEYQTSTTLSEGKNGIWNYTITDFRYTGGAHPNTNTQYLNIEAATGKVLTANDVFNVNDTAAICQLILKALIQETNKKMETDTITSLEGLQDNGVLLNTELYIPTNFLLGKQDVVFYYNRYEIAPYSSGDFTLHIPYSEINTYLKTPITNN